MHAPKPSIDPLEVIKPTIDTGSELQWTNLKVDKVNVCTAIKILTKNNFKSL